MCKEKDITGKIFGHLTAIKKIGYRKKQNTWLFKCDCGQFVEINKQSVVRGLTKSCGCLWRKAIKEANSVHNGSKTRLYQCWRDMKVRCYLKTSKNYKNYGGRGITVCDEWLNDFSVFSDWAKNNGYNNELTLDRIDVNGNYCPENCRWATFYQQSRNKRKNHFITFEGERKILKDWLKLFNVKGSGSFYFLKKKGFTDEESLSCLKEKYGVKSKYK